MEPQARSPVRVALASDHAGRRLKDHLVDFVTRQLDHPAVDLGTHRDGSVDYPDFAEAVAAAVRGGEVDRGVLICGSGVGASVAANKFPGVRAGLCHDAYSAAQGVEHDDMNVLVLGARVIGPALAEDLVRRFLEAGFTDEERHRRRLEKVAAIERRFALGESGALGGEDEQSAS